MELNACQIACTDGWIENKEALEYELQDKIWDRFGNKLRKISITYNEHTINFKKELIGKPLISVGIGIGLPNTAHAFTPYKNGVTFTGQKAKKWFNNVVI